MKKNDFAVALVGISVALALTGCGSSDKSDSSGSAAEDTFVLGEFTIIPPSNTLHAGRVTLTADNVGGEVHELLIVRADSIGALPKKSDGSVDEDKIAEADKLGEIEDVAAGSRKSKEFDLSVGKYVAICNIADSMTGPSSGMGHDGMGSGTGHIHFAEGMAVPFRVS